MKCGVIGGMAVMCFHGLYTCIFFTYAAMCVII